MLPKRLHPHCLTFYPTHSLCVALQSTALARGLVLYRLPEKGKLKPPVSPTVWLCLLVHCWSVLLPQHVVQVSP